MFCILDYRYYSHCLNIFPRNSTDYELFDKFGHHHYQILFAHGKLSDKGMIHSHLSVASFPFFHGNYFCCMLP